MNSWTNIVMFNADRIYIFKYFGFFSTLKGEDLTRMERFKDYISASRQYIIKLLRGRWWGA